MAAPVPLDRIPPTTTAYVIATAILAGVTGYFIGQGASLNLFKEKQGWPNGYDVKVHKDSSDEEEEESEEESEDEGNGEELADFQNNAEEVKLVLVVRTDLGMTKGMYPPAVQKRAWKNADAVLWIAISIAIATTMQPMLTRTLYRKNCRPSLPRYPRLLQIFRYTCSRVPDSAPVGAHGTGQDCASD